MEKKQMKFRVIGLIAALFILCLPALCRAEAPVIDNVEIFNYHDLTNPVLEFVIGDEVTVIVYGRDADLDCSWLKISQYLLDDSVAIPVYEDWIFLGVQETENDTFHFDADITGPVGDWRIDFQLEDEAGNLSEIYSVFTTVNDPFDPVSDSGGGGGGGCYISISGRR